MQVLKNKDYIESFLSRSYRVSRSYSTVRSYKVALNKFQKFLKEDNLDIEQLMVLLKEKTLDPYDILDRYFTFLSKRNASPNTVIHYVTTAKEFLNANGMHIYREDLKHKFRLPRRTQTYEEGLSREIIGRVLRNSSQKLQTAILVAASSGMRIGELVQLRLSDVDFGTTPTTIRIRRDTCKTRQTRITHISDEATKTLKDYLRKSLNWDGNCKDDRYIFMYVEHDADTKTYDNAVISAKTNLGRMLRDTVKNIPELAMKNENGINSIHFHAFRKWFKTQVTNAHQSDFAESLMGHMSIKLTYYLQNAEQRQKTYLKVEPELTITDFTKIENSIESMKEKIDLLSTDLEKSNEENDLLKNKIDSIQKTQALSDLETKKTIIRILRQQKIIP